MTASDKPLVWLHGELKTPPLSRAARLEAGLLLRQLQSRRVNPSAALTADAEIGRRCHELRVQDRTDVESALPRRR